MKHALVDAGSKLEGRGDALMSTTTGVCAHVVDCYPLLDSQLLLLDLVSLYGD